MPHPTLAPQHELSSFNTRRATSPYFSFTIFLMSVVLTFPPICSRRFSAVQRPCSWCSIRRREILGVVQAHSCWPSTTGMSLRDVPARVLRASAFPSDGKEWNSECRAHCQYHPRQDLLDGRTTITA